MHLFRFMQAENTPLSLQILRQRWIWSGEFMCEEGEEIHGAAVFPFPECQLIIRLSVSFSWEMFITHGKSVIFQKNAMMEFVSW